MEHFSEESSTGKGFQINARSRILKVRKGGQTLPGEWRMDGETEQTLKVVSTHGRKLPV